METLRNYLEHQGIPPKEYASYLGWRQARVDAKLDDYCTDGHHVYNTIDTLWRLNTQAHTFAEKITQADVARHGVALQYNNFGPEGKVYYETLAEAYSLMGETVPRGAHVVTERGVYFIDRTKRTPPLPGLADGWREQVEVDTTTWTLDAVLKRVSRSGARPLVQRVLSRKHRFSRRQPLLLAQMERYEEAEQRRETRRNRRTK